MDLLDPDTDVKHDTPHDKRLQDPSENLIQTSETSPEQNHIHSLAAPSEGDGGSRAKTEALCTSRPRDEREGEESEREETESSDDNTTQYSIHPPHDCPYLLLLQGCSAAQVRSSHTQAGMSPEMCIYTCDGWSHCFTLFQNQNSNIKWNILIF